MISIVQLGTVDYATGLRLQQQLVALRKEGKIGDVLLLLEHKPVITLGRNAKAANVVASSELLKLRGVELFECDRGGDVTFHGPGQLVGYPIFDLRGFPRGGHDFSRANRDHETDAALAAEEISNRLSSRADAEELSSRASRSESDGESRACPEQPTVGRAPNGDLLSPDSSISHVGADPLVRQGEAKTRPVLRKSLGIVDFVRCLEDVLMRTCADFAIPTKRIPGLTGVWTDGDLKGRDFSRAVEPSNQERALAPEGREAKLVAIGVHISRFVTSHGFALNVNTDLSYFNLIVPCGIASKPVTSMQQELGHEVDLNAVAESISRNFGVVFESQILWVDTIDALLGHTVGVPMKPPAELRQIHKEDDTTWV